MKFVVMTGAITIARAMKGAGEAPLPKDLAPNGSRKNGKPSAPRSPRSNRTSAPSPLTVALPADSVEEDYARGDHVLFSEKVDIHHRTWVDYPGPTGFNSYQVHITARADGYRGYVLYTDLFADAQMREPIGCDKDRKSAYLRHGGIIQSHGVEKDGYKVYGVGCLTAPGARRERGAVHYDCSVLNIRRKDTFEIGDRVAFLNKESRRMWGTIWSRMTKYPPPTFKVLQLYVIEPDAECVSGLAGYKPEPADDGECAPGHVILAAHAIWLSKS